MKYLIPSLLFVILCTQHVIAEVLKIPVGSQPPASAAINTTQLPDKGQLMDEVLRKFGEPEQRITPVGNPPITKWEYPDFTVYFEYEHVIHTVIRFTRQNPIEQTP